MSLPRKVTKVFLGLAVAWLAVCHSSTGFFYSEPDDGRSEKNCFCELQGSINDCSCTVDTVDHFNNMKIFPRLQSLLIKDFFRFYKVNLRQECPFWADDSKCAMRFCHVQSCEDKDIPEGLKGQPDQPESPAQKYLEETQDLGDCNEELSYLNTSISPAAHQGFQKWADHDAAEEEFCILDDTQNGAEYVDLLLNPERYTGYKGESAHRIWKSIYLENCFKTANQSQKLSAYIPQLDMSYACMEQRAFYRLISGLHASINIHLSAKYLLSESKDFLDPKGVWGPNVKEFQKRFSPETTNNEGPHWLRNLYFIYLVELRALAKIAPFLRKEEFYTGSQEEDREVKVAVNDLLNVVESFTSHFDESLMFTSGLGAIKLKSDFREKFRNISRIMDCVGCDKCRLWGKLQTQGLGTALKILFSEKLNYVTETNSWNRHTELGSLFRLSRTEIVALFNAFGRLSNSIYALEDFRKRLRQ
ncbi:unnamed protein product [Hermetia illucens]|uniref:Ero1-like protein n=1 Tax=Hermetia illucens TaxID=343691 RepID=A0A7R8UM16_HERIL|nr:ero1-like protein [Hermetia illucens]CAD7083353.1 unnamed protein product [Hermetia illucens]